MTRMPEAAKNLPDPADVPSNTPDLRILRLPISRPPGVQPEVRVGSALSSAVDAYISSQNGGQGLFPTLMESFNIVRSCEPMLPMRAIYRPSLCVVLEGSKEIWFGKDRLTYAAMECLVVSLDLPGNGRIVDASADAPYTGLVLDLDVAVLRDVVEHLSEPPVPPNGAGPCAFVCAVDEALADCFTRLVRMAGNPNAIAVLYPLVMREICYWLLNSPHGGELYRLTLPDSSVERVAKAIAVLHTSFNQTLRVEQLAAAAHMSASSFHHHFKALTSMTPLQFQKQLRLLEARRLMVADAATVAEAAWQVGYESPSQFSREYSRMFGTAPKQDVLNQQRLYREYASRTVKSA